MNLLEMSDIRKSFSGVPVLKGVQIHVGKGEIHALLGENGAGKSTLMNVLTGVFPYDSGSIVFDGRPMQNITIRLSEKRGISFVHQDLNLFNDLKVYENIFLGKEYRTPFGALDKKRMIEESGRLFQKLGVNINPDAVVANLKASEKQLLEISKALLFKAKLLILDEPTTSLNNEEVAHLFKIVKGLKAAGTSFIFISHKMPEIFELCDRYTVLRNGEYVAEGNIADIKPEQITRLMVGESFSGKSFYVPRQVGEPVLELRDCSGNGFHNVDMVVRRGQIIGLTGLQGSGSSELMQSIFGVSRLTSGSIRVFGKPLTRNSIHSAMRARIAMLPTDRKENSMLQDMSLLENMYIAEHTLSAWRFHIRKSQELRKFERFKKLLNIIAESSVAPITSLSGGNQQKVFLARWLNTEAEIFLLDNPTQGIDVGAKAEIYKLILEMAKNGKTILINTLEIPEIMKVADCCVVFYEGGIVKALEHDEISEHTVMLYSTNAVSA